MKLDFLDLELTIKNGCFNLLFIMELDFLVLELTNKNGCLKIVVPGYFKLMKVFL